MSLFGGYCIIDAYSYRDERVEVISRVLIGIIIISVTIINYIFYLKKALKDMDQEVREENKRRTMKIGEILELIFFTIFLLTPIWRIPSFIKLSETSILIIEIGKSIFVSFLSIILLYNLNPMDIKNKFKNTNKYKS